MPAEVPGLDPLIHQTLGHYRVLERIGLGGMGVVYRARDEHLDRQVAIKVLPERAIPDEHARKLLHKEAVALSKLNHTNIAAVHDFGTQHGLDFLVMEYVSGETLSRQIAASQLPEKEIAALGVQIAQALEEAHEHGIIHRDLKPANIAITPKRQVKVLDFGLAKFFDPKQGGLRAETLTQSVDDSHLLGTLPYMAPEQVNGEHVDARTDIYGLGVVLYEMATQKRPFHEESTPRLFDAILHQSLVAPRALNPRISPELERIILKCLEKEAESRYQSAKELAIDLRRLQTGALSETQLVVRPAKWRYVKSVGLSLGILGAVIVVLFSFNVGHWRDRLPERPRIRSLAVLPFTNLSGDPEQEYLADGVTEELTSDLAKIRELRVVSATSAMRYKRTNQSSSEISRQLHVDGIVEGSVQRSGNRVRVNAQLIYAPSDTHRWANIYEESLGDVLTLQDDVAKAIAREIKIALTPEEKVRLARTHAADPESVELYLKGRYQWNKRTPAGLMKSREYFQSAADQDPANALAFAGLADSYTMLGASEYGLVPALEAMPKAEEAAKQALQLDGTLAEAHSTLGYLRFFFDRDWAGSEREFSKAIELNPSYATGHHWYALYLAGMGRFPDAISEIKTAESLDPLSLIISADVGEVLRMTGRKEEAIEQLKKTLEMDPNFAAAHHGLAFSLSHEGRHGEAIAEMKRAVELAGDEPAWEADLAYVYGMAGQKDIARAVLNQLEKKSKQRFVPASDFAFAYLSLGDNDRAFYWLERAYAAHEDYIALIKVYPELDPLRPDPRFQVLVQRMNFPQ